MPIPPWAWEKLRRFLVARRPKPASLNIDRGLAFWRRMGMWVTRIDHFPASYAVDYGQGEYPYVVVPCLYGRTKDSNLDGLAEYVKELHRLGFKVVGSQWGRGGTLDEAILEAEAGAFSAADYGFDGWVMNGEKNYEGGARSAAYVRRFREIQITLPLGWSPEPRLDLDHAVLQELGVCYMPQAYPLENGKDIPFCVEWGLKFGYELENIVPLIGAYPVNGVRSSAVTYREQARFLGLPGLILYTANQSADVPQFWRELVV